MGGSGIFFYLFQSVIADVITFNEGNTYEIEDSIYFDANMEMVYFCYIPK